MSFYPPLFSKFGKTCSDLLSQSWDAKKDDFKHGVVVKTQADKLSFVTTVNADDANFSSLSGKSKVTHKDKAYGESSVEVASNGKVKATTKYTQLAKGAIVNAEAEYSKGGVTGKTAVEYTRDGLATQLEYSAAKKSLVGSVAAGMNGLSVGAITRTDINKIREGAPVGKAVAVDFGAQYENGNMIGTLLIEKKSDVSLSVFHRASSTMSTGAKFTVSPASKTNSFAAAALYRFSPETSGKIKAEIADSSENGKAFSVSTYLQHKLANPNCVVAVSKQFGSANLFGVNVTFGDN